MKKKVILLGIIISTAINLNAKNIDLKIENETENFKAVKITYWKEIETNNINRMFALRNPIIGTQIINLENKKTKANLNIPKNTSKLSFTIINKEDKEFNLVKKMNGWFNFDVINLPKQDIELEIKDEKIELEIGKTEIEYKLEDNKFIKEEK